MLVGASFHLFRGRVCTTSLLLLLLLLLFEERSETVESSYYPFIWVSIVPKGNSLGLGSCYFRGSFHPHEWVVFVSWGTDVPQSWVRLTVGGKSQVVGDGEEEEGLFRRHVLLVLYLPIPLLFFGVTCKFHRTSVRIILDLLGPVRGPPLVDCRTLYIRLALSLMASTGVLPDRQQQVILVD